MDIVERLQEMPELTPAQYWEAQASMWHENYKEAAVEIERLRGQVEFERASLRSAFQEMREYDKQIEWLRKELQGQALGEKE